MLSRWWGGPPRQSGRRPAWAPILAVGWSWLLACSAPADIVEYKVPRTRLTVVLQGQTTVNPGRTVSFRHPKFGTLYFGLEDVRIHAAPTTKELAARKLSQAVQQKSASEVMEAARWALYHGLLAQFYAAVDKALEINPQHVDARRVTELKRRMDQPLGSFAVQEAELRRVVPRAEMKIQTSKHFILLYDTEAKPAPNHKKPRADERLDLLEMVYESFLLRFYSQGVELEIPRERLQVVLFREHRDYLDFATRLSPDLNLASGFWSKTKNVSVFFDQGSDEDFQVLKQFSATLQKQKADAIKRVTPSSKDTVRRADTFALLVEVAQENQDITVVSHEATHQMAGNTGLMPRQVLTPTWAAEGLATYFEAPNDAAWSGIGAVNEERLDWYKGLQAERRISNIDFIIGDQIFTRARSHKANLHAYGQAWALTHFLMERHFDQLMTYYRRLGEMPPDMLLSPEVLAQVFSEACGGDRQALDLEWRAYMRSLKTDVDKILTEK